jgi:zinc D-Ala-D-Ala dipeptidase
MKYAITTFIHFAITISIYSQTIIPDLGVVDSTGQVILVKSSRPNSTRGLLTRWELKEKKWRKIGKPIPVSLGRNGLGWGKGHFRLSVASPNQKTEGDGKSPSGIFSLGTAFGYETNKTKFKSLKFPFYPINPSTFCVDDWKNPFYNKILQKPINPNWNSAEIMNREDGQYKYGIEVLHNSPSTGKHGSCIFFHIWKKPFEPTSGCTAMSEKNILILLNWIDSRKNPKLIQLTNTDLIPLLPIFPGIK